MQDLEKSNQDSADQQAKNDVFNKVVENCKITGYDEEESKQLIDKQFEQFKQTADSYASYGYTYEQVLSMNGYDTEEALKEGIAEYVKKFLEQKMVLQCVAAKEGIKVTKDEVDKEIQNYMDTYQVKTKEQVLDYLGDDYFDTYLLSEKVINFLMENAVQVDHIEGEDATTEAEK